MQPDYCCYFHTDALEEIGMGFQRNGPSLFFLCKNSGNSEGDDRPPGRPSHAENAKAMAVRAFVRGSRAARRGVLHGTQALISLEAR